MTSTLILSYHINEIQQPTKFIHIIHSECMIA